MNKLHVPSFSIVCFITFVSFIQTSCNSDSGTSKSATKDSIMANPIIEKKYGSIDSLDIVEYTIFNAAGFNISVINYGATLTGIHSKDKQGNLANVLLHFDNLDGYLQKGNPYFGAVVGRYANRIGK
ncbi:MAG: hypothetical protein ABIR81_11340, partial [Ginsengibacter sp.]